MIPLIRRLLIDFPMALRGILWRAALCLMGGSLGPGARIGSAARMVMGSRGAPIQVGPYFRMLRFAVVNTLPPAGRVVIGRWVHLGESSMITSGGLVEIGDDVVIGPQTLIVDTDHEYDDPAVPIRVQGLVSRPIRIGQGAWIAGNVSILKGVTVGRGAIVGAGAVVTQDVPPFAIVAGVPARVLKYRPGAPSESRGDPPRPYSPGVQP
jgi:acetyltransferase-like isoleucine patch superfamily enzyme